MKTRVNTQRQATRILASWKKSWAYYQHRHGW